MIENHSISELIDNCLADNKNKTIKILTENKFNKEEFTQQKHHEGT